jgi:hypothetical protein
MSEVDNKLTDEEREIIDYHMNMLLYGPVYKALDKLLKGYNFQTKEIVKLREIQRALVLTSFNANNPSGGSKTP